MLDFEYERLDVMVEAEIPTAADTDADDDDAAIDGGNGDAAAEPPLLPYGSAGDGPVGGATTDEVPLLPPLPGAEAVAVAAEAAAAAAALGAPL